MPDFGQFLHDLWQVINLNGLRWGFYKTLQVLTLGAD
jgi:hypothetical protein